jgi:ABC-type proline/glycine betaine transport system permease subunit
MIGGSNNNNMKFSERIGDWVCYNCDNLNFAFRIVCNRCQLPKQMHNNMKWMITINTLYILLIIFTVEIYSNIMQTITLCIIVTNILIN